MSVKGASNRLEFLTRQLSQAEWRLIAAIAVERELGLGSILRLATAFGLASSGAAARWNATASASGGAARRLTKPGGSATVPLRELADWQTSGLVIEQSATRVSSAVRASSNEPVFAVHPDFRQLILRRVAARGELQTVVEATHGLLGDRSLGVLVLLLHAGRLADFQRYTYALPRAASRLGEELGSEDLLREVICEPFDAAWFEGAFGDAAPAAAERVLTGALYQLWECDQLFAWLRQRVDSPPAAPKTASAKATKAISAASLASENELEERPVAPSSNEQSRRRVLSEHAFLRGRPELIETYAEALPEPERLAFRAAAAYQSGDQASAQHWLDALVEAKEGTAKPSDARRQRASAAAPDAGAAAPLLALLALSRGTTAAQANAKRWITARVPGDGLAGAERGFRTLLRYSALPESECARLDVHQLAPSARGWELLLLGLTVHLYLKQEVTRASWSRELTRSGAAWLEAGYSWLGRQALLLARALDAAQFQREFDGLGARELLGAFEQRPGEFALSDLITPKPEWERTLDALEQLADEPVASVENARRVAWYVNIVERVLDRPALQELSQGGWSRGRRLTLGQLHALAADLPAEDLAVLHATREIAEGKREFLPEAFEALVGHPRVFNGARGGTRMEVTRGVCHVETSDANGYLTIQVEPPGARLGVNVTIEGENRVVVYRVNAALARVIELLPRGLRVPEQQAEQALRVLGKLSHGVEVNSKHLGADKNVEADATPCLRVVPQAGSWLIQAGVRPFGAQGRFFLAGTGRASLSLYSGGQRLRAVRDFALERARLSRLIMDCPSLLERSVGEDLEDFGDGPGSWDLALDDLLDLLMELRESSERCELEWPESEALKVRGRMTTRSLHGTLRRKKGWYLAAGSVQLDADTELELGDLAGSVPVAQGRFVRLPNGDFVALEERVRKVVAALQAVEPLAHRPRELEFHAAELHALSALGELADNEPDVFTLDAGARGWLERVEAVKTQNFEPPKTLLAELRSYQLAGFHWLSRLSVLGLGACLADDMGLGKTVQILAVLLDRAQEGPTLVVAPTSVCTNWQLEAARFAPSLTVLEYSGPERAAVLAQLAASAPPGHVIVCSYGLLQQDIEALAAIEWGTLVLDEAQFIKNPKSLRAQAARRLNAGFRIAATGTPVENHLGDLWSIFSFLNPGLLGSWRNFGHRFLKPIEQQNDAAARQALKDQIRPFLLRRIKSEVLADLPPLTLVHHPVTLSEAEALGYQRLRREIGHRLTRVGRRDNKLEVLAEITRLRRYCCHPRLVSPDAPSEGSKIEALIELVLELRENQHRALVFSQFVDFLELVRERLEEVGVSYQYLDGSTPKAERQVRVEAFQAGEGSLFLISLKAGGFGLNLTAADYVIHLDPWWNPAVEAQATDRAHRIGQDRPVTVYRLITKDTIEESIVELYQSKRALAESLLSEGNQAAQLSVTELVELIEVEPSVA